MSRKSPWTRISTLAALIGSVGGLVSASAAAAGDVVPPRLAVLLVVDQLRRDRVDAGLPGGIGRLAREGRVFRAAELAHAASETCPGHAALATGRHPGAAGLPANYVVDRASGVVEYCLEDDPEASAVLGLDPPSGRSPRRMRVDALGDWLQQAHPRARVLAVSAKDRAAIALGGQHPTGAYWLIGPKGGPLGFTTSRYYAPELPSWVRAWNGWGEAPPAAGLLARVPSRWDHLPEAAELAGPARPDDYPYESARTSGRVSGHALRGEGRTDTARRIYASPFLDRLTLDFAAASARELGLGDDEVPDLLAVSLSATDLVGHEFGPDSHEARDALLRLDDWLSGWLRSLEARVGRGRVVVALSSDHGILPLPEWLAETGRSRCPVAPGRIALGALHEQLERHLQRELLGFFSRRRRWTTYAGPQLTVDRTSVADAALTVDEVVAAAEAWLEARPEIAAVWTAEELSSSADPMARRFRRSRDPERSGDLALQPEPDCLLSPMAVGTNHGAPYDYDREVPIVLWGPGIAAGFDDRAATTVDVAPTLAALLGIAVPEGLDGHSLLDAPVERPGRKRSGSR